MRISSPRLGGANLAVLMALSVASIMGPLSGRVHANGDDGRSGALEQAARSHQSALHIKDSDLPSTRAIKVGRNKSVMVEMPRDLRDVMVSNPEIVDAVVQSANRVYLIGKKLGQANAFFYDSTGEQVLTLEIAVEQDIEILDSLLRRLIPGSNIKSEILNDTVILTGSVRSPIDSNRASDIASRFAVAQGEGDGRSPGKVVNLLAVEGEEQVMLRVVVAEVQRSVLKQFGINIGATINAGNFVTSVLSENALPLTSGAGLGSLPVPGVPTGGTVDLFNSGPATGVFGNSGVASIWSIGGSTVAQAIRAMEREGLIRTLAEPNLTAVSGEAAKFLAGGEYPVPVVSGDGDISVTYKEFGVGVAFTPVVLSEGRISLKIETEVSELTNVGSVTLAGTAIPALKKRQAKSTVELPSGGSLAMAGLISDDVRQNIDGFPGLKDVPILGTLFRSRDYIKEETELVVIVTPLLVRPVARQELGRPLDGLAASSDMKANFLGHLNRIYGGGRPVPTGDLKGDYGFIVE